MFTLVHATASNCVFHYVFPKGKPQTNDLQLPFTKSSFWGQAYIEQKRLSIWSFITSFKSWQTWCLEQVDKSWRCAFFGGGKPHPPKNTKVPWNNECKKIQMNCKLSSLWIEIIQTPPKREKTQSQRWFGILEWLKKPGLNSVAAAAVVSSRRGARRENGKKYWTEKKQEMENGPGWNRTTKQSCQGQTRLCMKLRHTHWAAGPM